MTNCLLLSIFAFSLSACTSPSVLNIDNATTNISPNQISSQSDITNERVVWGGVIVDSKNLQNLTQLEILAYPLRRNLKPDTNNAALGRFIMQHAGYLETQDYAPGRKLTVVGSVTKLSRHAIGDASFNVPLLHSEEPHLWPVNVEQSQPQFSFGLGVSIGN